MLKELFLRLKGKRGATLKDIDAFKESEQKYKRSLEK